MGCFPVTLVEAGLNPVRMSRVKYKAIDLEFTMITGSDGAGVELRRTEGDGECRGGREGPDRLKGSPC